MSKKKSFDHVLDQKAHDAADSIGDAAHYLARKVDKDVAPLARQTYEKSVDFAGRTRDQLEPALNDAWSRIAPTVDAARDRVNDDLLPRVNDLLEDARRHPLVREASDRGTAALAALKGDQGVKVAAQELVESQSKKRRKKRGRTIVSVLALGAGLAAAAVAARRFLLSKDDNWTPHEPSPAKKHDADSKLVHTTTTPNPDTDSKTTEAPKADPIKPGPYGEGSFVGEVPPAGFYIKGNERSKKYHLPENGGYERTISDVWFSSEKAAEAAGFTRAQR